MTNHGSDRASPCRTELDVSLCFASLLKWVLSWWRGDRLALAIDPTLKGDDTAAIVISVLYRGCAIPVAPYPVRGRFWRILRAKRPGSWMDPIVELLQALAPAAPGEMTVIVLCDRGLNSPKLWRQIRGQSLPRTGYGGWHPYVRYPKNITFCAEGGQRLPARSFVSQPDTAWIGSGTAFKGAAKRRCTLLVVWCADQPEPWIILTDQPLEAVGVSWYGLRFWPRVKHGVTLSNWVSKPAPYWIRGPSRAWAGNGTRPGGRTRRASPAIGWLCRWQRCWPWPTAPEWRTPRTARSPPGRLRTPAPQRRGNSGHRRIRTVSVIRYGIGWLRRLLHQGRLWRRVWLLPEPWPEPQSQFPDHPPCPFLNSPLHTPVRYLILGRLFFRRGDVLSPE